MISEGTMSSNRPYLIRGLYEWISDNHLTPYLLVDASHPTVKVPILAVKDNQVVLNIAMQAVQNLQLSNHAIEFLARFSGISHAVYVPTEAVLAIYAHENGQGMMFPRESHVPPRDPPEMAPHDPTGGSKKKKSTQLKLIK